VTNPSQLHFPFALSLSKAAPPDRVRGRL
jgi:hypothetical protein